MKRLALALATLAVLPAFLVYRLGALAVGPAKAFPGWSQAFALLPGLSGVYLRRAFYRLTLAGCGGDAFLSFGSVFSGPGARVGRGVFVGAYCCLGESVLEDDVLLASGVSVVNGGRQHGTDRLDVPIRLQPGVWEGVTVGRGAWVGERAVVMADVGAHCVIGAGAVVTRPVPDYAVAVGVPAKVVSYRNGARGPSPSPAGAPLT